MKLEKQQAGEVQPDIHIKVKIKREKNKDNKHQVGEVRSH